MPLRIFAILDRLRQDLRAMLTPEAILEACHQEGHQWRDRRLDPVTTIYLFLLQILHGNTACQHTVHFGGWSFTDSAYCTARKRLPLGVFQRLLEQVTATFRQATESTATWRGHRVWLCDGSSFSMPDTPALQAAFGQPSGQAPGCGFPVAKFLALFDWTTGLLRRVEPAPLRSHEMARCATVTTDLSAGDVVLADRGFCSFAHLALLVQRSLHAVFRVHQRQIVDFTPGRPDRGRRSKTDKRSDSEPELRPNSRWVRAHSRADQIVVWSKPASRPNWMTPEQYAALPETITVRELRYQVQTPGFRTREVTLVTTLLEAEAYPASALAELYGCRWQAEINFKHLKITMGMDVLKCKSHDGVLKELMMFALVYNLVRSVMAQSAQAQGVSPDRISLVDTVRWLIGSDPSADLTVLRVNPRRPGRVEPRAVKRRPKQYPRLTKPRRDLRNALLNKEVAP